MPEINQTGEIRLSTSGSYLIYPLNVIGFDNHYLCHKFQAILPFKDMMSKLSRRANDAASEMGGYFFASGIGQFWNELADVLQKELVEDKFIAPMKNYIKAGLSRETSVIFPDGSEVSIGDLLGQKKIDTEAEEAMIGIIAFFYLSSPAVKTMVRKMGFITSLDGMAVVDYCKTLSDKLTTETEEPTS